MSTAAAATANSSIKGLLVIPDAAWESLLSGPFHSLSDESAVRVVLERQASFLQFWPRASTNVRERLARLVKHLPREFIVLLLDLDSFASSPFTNTTNTTEMGGASVGQVAFALHALQTLDMMRRPVVQHLLATSLMWHLSLTQSLMLLGQLRDRSAYAAVCLAEACSAQLPENRDQDIRLLNDFIVDSYLLPYK